jgi:hypothetical protein
LVPQNFLPQASRICPVTSREVHLLRTNKSLVAGILIPLPTGVTFLLANMVI